MGIDNPVGEQYKDPYDRYRILREGGGGGEKPPGKKPHLAAQILALLKNAVDALLNFGKKRVVAEKASPQEHLFLLKTALDTLKKEDRSQDVLFLNQLSDVWHRVLEDSLGFLRSDPYYEPFKLFLDELQNYPPGDEHSFAYYLTEYTGQAWLPFPYMDLIHHLHNDYQNHPKESALERWTKKIEELRALLIQV